VGGDAFEGNRYVSGILYSDSGRIYRTALPSLFTVAASLTSGLVAFVAARWIGPQGYGQAQEILLAYALAGLVQIGAFSAGVRSSIHQQGLGQTDVAAHDLNVGVSVDILVSVVPGIALGFCALAATNSVAVVGLALAPLIVGMSSLAGFVGGIEIANGRTARATIVAAIGTVAGGLVAIATVRLIGPIGLFLGALVGGTVSVLILLPRLRRAGLRFTWDLQSARHLTKQGYPLAVNSVTYWAYRWIGPLSVAIALGSKALGLYSLAVAPVALGVAAVTIAAKQFMPGFWQDMARNDRWRWIPEGDRMTLVLVMAAAILATLGQAIAPWFVRIALPAFAPSVPIFEILALEMPLIVAPIVASLVLDSKTVSRQRLHAGVWVAGLVLNGVANAIVLALGVGAIGIAWNDVAIQGLMMVLLMALAARHQGLIGPRVGMLLRILGVLLLGSLLGTALLVTERRYPTSSAEISGLGLRLAATVGLWAVGGGIVMLLGRRGRVGTARSARTPD
jgi:O-antigen/teichoic acid export membrane protein